MAESTVSMREVKKLLNYTIDNNFKLQENGKLPIAIGLIADAGIGKTSVVEQVAKERGMGFTSLVLSQLEESGDLIGFPLKEYECQVAKQVKQADGTVKMQILPQTMWLNEKQLENPTKGFMYRQTGNTRMSYAKPAWVPEYNENGNILLLDDLTRANPQLLQSAMEVIYKQGYVSWKLPKKSCIIITANPDNGEYNVSSTDEAQNGRYVGFNVSYDVNAWSQWAEGAGLDGRCINFVLSYSDELFKADEEGNRICNPRSFSMFADMISGLDDWDDADTQGFIHTIAKGCFHDENSRFANMFTAFLRNKMHLIVQPKSMLLDGWDKAKTAIEASVYDKNGKYRPDIAALLERRFCNFVSAWLDSDADTPISKVEKRIVDFIDNQEKDGKKLFAPDTLFHMIKTITSDHKRQTGKLMFNPKIAQIVN